MLKGRGRDPRVASSPTPTRSAAQAQGSRPQLLSPTHLTLRTPTSSRAPLAKPEPDYEVVEFPSEQYVNAKLQPPPPPPPRPPTGHPAEAASCGLCGGGGARVRCTECGRRALCASCDDMYHRHPKRRHHQRQALSLTQMRDVRPPLPPKAAPPVPPPRRHKMSGDRMSASPRPPSVTDQRNSIGSHPVVHTQTMPLNNRMASPHSQQIPAHLQKLGAAPGLLGSMPYLPSGAHHHAPAPVAQTQSNTLGHLTSGWGRPRGSMPGFNVPPNMLQQQMAQESWESPESAAPQNWGRPLRRGASVLELGGGLVGGACGGCAGCASGWRYGSCASLDHQPWGAWPPPACCHPPVYPHAHPHAHVHAPQTPQPYRRADSRAVSRTASRAGSRAASPAMSVRSRASRRTKHRTPSPPPLPSSDADSETESESDRGRGHGSENHRARGHGPEISRTRGHAPESDRGHGHGSERDSGHGTENDRRLGNEINEAKQDNEDWLGPPPAAASVSWQCEHCTFVNEPGVRVCAVCCRTPTAAPKIIDVERDTGMRSQRATDDPMSVAESARSVAESARGIGRLELGGDAPAPAPVRRVETRTQQNGQITNRTVSKNKERVSTGCGPSPPREEPSKNQTNRLVTPTREQNTEPPRPRHDMAVGPSPPRETQHSISVGPSLPRQNTSVTASPYKEDKQPETTVQHSVSIGPSPPRENTIRAFPVQKKSAGTSPPRDAIESRSSSTSLRANVSNTGTSPPPQTISTQTYEVPTVWERAPSASRSRTRRRFRDDSRRERSHSRHSLSSDTRESERSARTSGGGGRWEWRETRDSSPGAEWSGSEQRPPARLTRRASHLDLRRDARGPPRRASYYSQAPSPEPSRAMSLEALAGAAGASAAAAERGLELARLMAEAERLGFSAAEVQAALAQSPAAPLAWLRERWPSLCAGVRAAAARLAPLARVSELEARAALARHRGAMWPAVTDCVERHRRQTEQGTSAEGRVRGRVWGSPAGADDDAAPPPRGRLRAEDSSDEYDGPPNKLRDDDWMYLPLDAGRSPRDDLRNPWEAPSADVPFDDVTADVASDLRRLLVQARIPAITDDLLLRGLLSNNMTVKSVGDANFVESKPHLLDFIQSENDFIEAYNALTRSSPLPIVNNRKTVSDSAHTSAEINSKRDTYDVIENDSHSNIENVTNINNNNNIQNSHTSHKLINSTNNENQLSENSKSNELFQGVLDNTMQQVKALHSPSPTRRKKEKEENTDLILNSNNPIGMTKNDLTSDEQIEFKTSLPVNSEQVLSNTTIKSPLHKTITENNRVNSVSPMPQTVTQNNTKTVTPPMERVIAESNTEKTESEPQSQDKLNNLNEIVDNTQRLIQQMKDEINSDINSIDSRNISQSEADSSSNESDISTEHESSYSDTENKETDELSTEESQASSDEESEDHLHERRPTIIQRTSSEENDQFEEAMDHIEDQIEDFKNTNIEILDSIARSLKEEHTLSLQTIEPKLVNNKEDLNNNLFIEVNSFEEIYDGLISNSKEKSRQIKSNHSQNESSGVITNELEATSNIAKLIETNINEVKQITSNNELVVGNEDSIENLSKQSEILDIAPDTNQIIDKQIIAISTFKALPPIKLVISEPNQMALNAIIEEIDENIEATNEIQDNIVLQITEEGTFENNLIITETAVTSMNSLSQSSDEDDSKGTADSDVTPTDQTDLVDNDNTILENNPTKQNIINEIDENIDTTTQEDSHECLEKNFPTKHFVIDSKQKSPEKSFIKSPSENRLNKTFNAIKSNIPKLVKVVHNNKQKGDKTSPKIIASKVPVRRGSLKQYPAPAPPKSHFGNIQSGHVKQLQTRLFNNKFPKTAIAVPSTIEAKPSTSTMPKKKPAPLPPTQEVKQPSPSKASPPKDKKKNFFRESCRTEDEWTESDTEETPAVFSKENEEPNRPPSPPPPVTVRRVSGQIIDLAKVRLPEGSPERQARMLLAEGATETWEQARLAVELVSRGTEAASALLAALECADLPAALAYLHQDCELCAERLPEHEMVSMLRCTHRCCRECARLYFTLQVTERSIADCVCPYCKRPELESLPEDAWLEYFAHLDILLKALLDADVHELFQRKLRDRTLARDPNFRWCMECSSGFFVHPKQKKIRCPECRSVSCAKCRKPWSINHEGLSCEQYAAWLDDNDPERSIAAVQQHLRENGLECPRCHFKYSLSRGGCMHFTCTQCKYEFCYGCGKPFMMGARCGLSEYCAKLGLHAHHPRNCLFYLRDKEPHELQTLLQMNNVAYETEAPEGSPNRCPIQLQRETPTGLVDGTCGSEAPPNYAGLCKPHYVEYLAGAARRLDPIPIMDVAELVAELRRRALPLPERGPWDTDPVYAGMCAEIVKEKIPLD